MAQMRFGGQVEKMKSKNNAKDAEIEATKRAAAQRQEREDHWRKSTLFGNASHNLKMHKNLQDMRVTERIENEKEKIDIQTSLQSKKQQDADYAF